MGKLIGNFSLYALWSAIGLVAVLLTGTLWSWLICIGIAIAIDNWGGKVFWILSLLAVMVWFAIAFWGLYQQGYFV